MDTRVFPPVHPGEVLAEDFLKPLGITQYALAQATGLSQTHIGQIIRGQRSITPGVGLRLSKALGLTSEYWANMQARYDIEVALDEAAAAHTLDTVRVLVDA